MWTVVHSEPCEEERVCSSWSYCRPRSPYKDNVVYYGVFVEVSFFVCVCFFNLNWEDSTRINGHTLVFKGF